MILLLCAACTTWLFGATNPPVACCSPGYSDTITAPLPAVKYLALGDSYTIGQSVAVNDRFPMQAVTLLRGSGYNMADADIIATTGWTSGNLLHAIKDKPSTNPYDFVSLLIGVNNQFRGMSVDKYRLEFIALLKKSIILAGNP